MPAGRRQRIHRIRVRVAALALSLFIAAFAGIYIQMAQGHDPALSKGGSSGTKSAGPRTSGSTSFGSATTSTPLTTSQS
jgi:hypothetical protein